MDISYFIQTSQKNKHLSFEHYEYIVHVVMKHELAHKGKKRNTDRQNNGFHRNLEICIPQTVNHRK